MKYYLFLFFTFLFSCNKNDTVFIDKNRTDQPDSFYFDKIAANYGLPLADRMDSLQHNLKDFQSEQSKNRPIYFLLKTKYFRAEAIKDSTLFYFDKIVPEEHDHEMKILKFLEENSLSYQPRGGATYDKSSKILRYIKFAEQHKSMFTFILYREMAEVYYLNFQLEESLQYNELWFKNNPLKNEFRIKESFYSNCFAIAHQMEKADTMKVYIDKIKDIANHQNNENLTAKVQNYEAQYYYLKKDYKSALESSKKYFNYFKKNDALGYDNYHNLAVAFLENKELDSALFYLKKAYIVAENEGENLNGEMYFKVLAEVYDKQGDYKNASIAKDSVQKHYYAFKDKIENEKLEELKIQYDTEKKDTEIKNLHSTNELHKILMFGGAFLFVSIGSVLYMIYKRRLLKAKNEKLAIENKKLNIEQRALQLQLNPHFVYNSIANLQGLIVQGESEKSVNYLTSFSKLLRNILELNREDFIPLKDEIASVSNYMKLQQMRFEGLFDYEINLPENYDTEFVLIRPMLLQPFLENSIEHGFKNIDHKGKIEISFAIFDKKLTIEIKDNGTGINKIKRTIPIRNRFQKL